MVKIASWKFIAAIRATTINFSPARLCDGWWLSIQMRSISDFWEAHFVFIMIFNYSTLPPLHYDYSNSHSPHRPHNLFNSLWLKSISCRGTTKCNLKSTGIKSQLLLMMTIEWNLNFGMKHFKYLHQMEIGRFKWEKTKDELTPQGYLKIENSLPHPCWPDM